MAHSDVLKPGLYVRNIHLIQASRSAQGSCRTVRTLLTIRDHRGLSKMQEKEKKQWLGRDGEQKIDIDMSKSDKNKVQHDELPLTPPHLRLSTRHPSVGI